MICACEKKQFVPRLKSGGITERFRKRVIFAEPQRLHNAVCFGIPVCKHPAAVRPPIRPPVLDNFKTEVLETKLPTISTSSRPRRLRKTKAPSPSALPHLNTTMRRSAFTA